MFSLQREIAIHLQGYKLNCLLLTERRSTNKHNFLHDSVTFSSLPEYGGLVEPRVNLCSTRKTLGPTCPGRTECCNAQAPCTSDHFRRNSGYRWTGLGQAAAQQDNWASSACHQQSGTYQLFWGTTYSSPVAKKRSSTTKICKNLTPHPTQC